MSTKFGFDDDDAPAIIIPNQSSPSGARPGPDDPAVRGLERAIGGATAYNPIDGKNDPITVNLADETEESILHMVNADPDREPTFTLFGNPAYYFEGECTKVGAAQGKTPAYNTAQDGCPVQDGGTPGTTATSSRRSHRRGRDGSGPGSRTSARPRRSGPITPTRGRR